MKALSNANSESSQTQETPPLDQSTETGRDRALSMTYHHTTGETERQLSERVIELEKEVCIRLYFCECV